MSLEITKESFLIFLNLYKLSTLSATTFAFSFAFSLARSHSAPPKLDSFGFSPPIYTSSSLICSEGTNNLSEPPNFMER